MPLTASKPKSTYAPVPEGTYAARIYSIIDLGTHSESYMGGDPSDKRKIRITWELPTEVKTWEKDGQEMEAPYVIGKEYTLSMGQKSSLRKHIELMTTTLEDEEAYAMDVFSLIGTECMLSVGHKESKEGNVYAFINTVARLPKGMTCPKAFNPYVVFNTEEFDQKVFDALPKFMQEKIDASMERNGKENREAFLKANMELMGEEDINDIV